MAKALLDTAHHGKLCSNVIAVESKYNLFSCLTYFQNKYSSKLSSPTVSLKAFCL